LLIEIQVLGIMSITVKVYGDLREKVDKNLVEGGIPKTLNLEHSMYKSVSDLITALHLKKNDIAHIFVNGAYCGDGTILKKGDRVGLFPKKMAAMFVEIPDANSYYITLKLFANLRKYGKDKRRIKVPRGTSLSKVIKLAKIPKEEGKLIILVNGIPQWDRKYVVKTNDTVAIFPPLAGG
jgi:molybdopterin converting factor small subunit